MHIIGRHPAACNDGTCPAIYDLDHPGLIGVQGHILTDPQALREIGTIPEGEGVVVLPKDLLDGYRRVRLGRALKLARVLAGLSGAQIAPAVGASQSTVSRWERGGSLPTLAQVAAWAEACGSPGRAPMLVRLLEVTAAGLGGLRSTC